MPKTKRAADLHRRPNCPRRAESRQATARREQEESMPCHVPATSASSRRSRPSLPLTPPVRLAALDLRKQPERAAHDLIRSFCCGRWPLWRILGMRREGESLYVAVEWRRGGGREPYSVVEVSLKKTALRWWSAPSPTEARRRLQQGPPATFRPRVPAALPSSRRPGACGAGQSGPPSRV